MKTIFFKALFLMLAFMTATSLFTSCSDDDSDSPLVIQLATDNEIFVNQVKATEFKSIFFNEYFGYKMVVASPTEGLSSWNDVVDNNQPYIMVLISDSLVNKPINVMEKVSTFSVISFMTADAGGEYAFSSEDSSAVASGLIEYAIDENNKAGFVANFVLANNTIISIALYGDFIEPEVSNVINIGDNQQIISSSFYDDSAEGTLNLYFTPQVIDNGEDIQSVKQYSTITIDEKLIGTTIDIATEEGTYMYASFDNYMAEEDMFFVTTGYTQDATGTITVNAKDEKGGYTIDVNITSAQGVNYSMHFDGTCAPYYTEPENALTIQGVNPKTLYSAVVDQTSDIWTVYLSTEAGIKTVADMKDSEYVSFTMPKSSFDGDPHGFSTDATLSITYNGKTYGLGNTEHRGTLSGTITGDEILVTLKEWTTPFEAYYHGKANIIK